MALETMGEATRVGAAVAVRRAPAYGQANEFSSPEPSTPRPRPAARGIAKASEPTRRDVVAAKSGADGERLDVRLASVLDKLNRSFEEAERFGAAAAADRETRRRSPTDAPKGKGQRVLDDAIAAISRRQSVLDATASEARSAVFDRRREPIGSAAERARGGTSEGLPTPQSSSQAGSAAAFADLHAAFKTLAEKLDARLAETAVARVSDGRDPDQNSEFKALQNDIAGLALRIDRMQDEANGREKTERHSTEIDSLRQEIAQISGSLADLAPQRSLDSLEGAVRDLVGRVDLSKLDGVHASVLAPVERLSREMREAIRSADPSKTVDALRRDMQALATRVEAMRAQNVDPEILLRVQDETREIRQMLSAASGRFSVADRLEKELTKLGERVDQLAEGSSPAVNRALAQEVREVRTLLKSFEPDGVLGTIDRKIDALAARVDSGAKSPAHGDLFQNLALQIDRAHESLAARLSARDPGPVDLSPLEERIGTLSAKLDTFGRSSQDVNALYGLVGGLVDRIDEARNPQAETEILNALQAQIGQLVERLDRSETSNTVLAGLERSIGDLFLQIEQSRNIAIDAAENAARTAAQDTLRAAMDNPSLNGGELTVQTGLDVDHVSQELAQLRRAQETSERRVNATLNALNTTLERLVDRMIGDPAGLASKPMEPAPLPSSIDDEGLGGKPARRRLPRTLAEPLQTPNEDRAAHAAFDPEQFLLEPGSSPRPARSRASQDLPSDSAPAVEVGRSPVDEPGADVAPLIAAARRAAKAAQASAFEATQKAKAQPETSSNSASASKTRSFFAQKRRPLLLGLAGLVLLLGTLQIAKISSESGPVTDLSGKDAVPKPAPVPPVVTPDSTSSAAPTSAQPSERKAPSGSASLLAPPSSSAGVSSSFNAPAPSGETTQSASLSSALADPALSGVSQGLRDLAGSGNAAAQFEIALRLSEGRTVTRDPKLALAWFQRAAQQGLAPAQYRLGSLYEKGIGVTADAALAMAWYEKAAAQGNVRAMHNLAVMSAEGSGSKPDYAKAVAWFVKASNYGVRDSQFNLAVLYARGLGAAQSLTQSYSWFAIAAAQGDTDALQKRDAVAAKLDAKSLADAKAAVDSFKPLTPAPQANDVLAPAGGWDAVAPAKSVLNGSPKYTARFSSM